MQSRWNESAAPRDARALLAYASDLIGRESDLVLPGGGNTSVKSVETDHLGRRRSLLSIKPSGVPLAGIRPEDFTALRLADLEPLAERGDVDDATLESYVLGAMVDPRQRRPSLETLLHAFLPDRWILHSHADALLAISNRPDGESRLMDLFGKRVALVPYRRPGFRLSADVAAAYRSRPGIDAIVLMQHGLLTFGADAREAYERHIDIVTRCEEASPPRDLPPPGPPRSPPLLRGVLGRGYVLSLDGSDDMRAILADEALLAASLRGPATSDHVLRTGPWFCRADGIARWRSRFREHAGRGDREGLPEGDATPRVLLAPGTGVFGVGRCREEADAALDIARHTLRMVRRAGPEWAPIAGDDLFHAQYWALQHRKVEGPRRGGELESRVAWISGAASGIGRAIAERFAAEGAHLLLADIDLEGARGTAQRIGRRAVAVHCDVTSEDQVAASFERGVREYGGIDIVVSNAGIAKPANVEDLTLEEWERSFAVNARSHFLVGRAALRHLRVQGLGGAIVFNASKNVMAPGKGFAAYSASKAAEAQLAKVLALEGAEIGVRVNTLHPDAVFQGTRLWSDEMRRERAKAHGVAPEKLEEFYAKRNLLKVAVRPEDVAEAALFFASDRSSRITGACLPVDGGVKEAFPR